MIQLSQQWLNKASLSEDEDISVLGPSPVQELPDEIAKIVYDEFCISSAAKEIVRRQWVRSVKNSRESAEILSAEIKSMIMDAHNAVLPGALFRSATGATAQTIASQIASQIWLGHCAELGAAKKLKEFSQANFHSEAIQALVKMSRHDDGPIRASNFLAECGIAFIVASGLPSMKLDGAATILLNGTPLIALTLRYDRIDNFWFTLLHEIGHLKLHLMESPTSVFLDDLESVSPDDELESEANSYARDALIPRDQWRRSNAARFKTKSAALELAEKLEIHPAIVAGRLRYETRNYTIHSELLGQDNVREQLIEMDG